MRILSSIAVLLIACYQVPGYADQWTGDPLEGEREYSRCQGCHSLTRHRTGPRHCGLLGRQAGSDKGFTYSSAMADSGLRWDRQTLDRFLTSPLKVVPGSTMGYAGVKQVSVRHNLIAYLIAANHNPALCPP